MVTGAALRSDVEFLTTCKNGQVDLNAGLSIPMAMTVNSMDLVPDDPNQFDTQVRVEQASSCTWYMNLAQIWNYLLNPQAIAQSLSSVARRFRAVEDGMTLIDSFRTLEFIWTHEVRY